MLQLSVASNSNDMQTAGCRVDLKSKAPADFDYVCDTMPGGWYHSDGESWSPASAGSGGCHVYKFMTGTPPDCQVGSACSACEDPPGTVVKEFYLIKDGCEEPSTCVGFSSRCPAADRWLDIKSRSPPG